jgi:N-succinyldiaminopimelate aminotransferase
MPCHPNVASTVGSIRESVFASLAQRIAGHRGPVYPLHLGDTWLDPPEGCRMADLHTGEHPALHRYAPPRGLPALSRAIAERLTRRTGVPTEPDQVLVTAGATGALSAITRALVEPGEEVLILAPYWPLITGIVAAAGAVPVVVPFLGEVDSPESAVAAVRRARSERAAALYLSSPNNPTGIVLPRAWVTALVDWATRENLWIFTDEVYEDYVYAGVHVYARALAPERTLSAHSFSKAYGMAGNRCGFAVGPARIMPYLCKVSTHSCYSAPTASQIAATRALDGRGDEWVTRVRAEYLEAGSRAARRLGVAEPMGGTFLFVDVAERLDARGLPGFLEDCAERGVFVAPGPSFGDYPSHVRVCFTAIPPGQVAAGVELLAALLGR